MIGLNSDETPFPYFMVLTVIGFLTRIENAKRYTASKEWPDKSAYDMHTSGFYGAWGFKNVPYAEIHRAIELVGGNGAHLRFPWKRAKVSEMRTLNASMAHP